MLRQKLLAFTAALVVLSAGGVQAPTHCLPYWMWGNYYGPVPIFSSAHTAAAANAEVARITVRLPADARLSFDDYQTTLTGPERTFDTPPLDVGRRYNYELRARWKEGGRDMERTQTIHFGRGDNVAVDFTRPAP
jgi:uncharacterized protein (TIGR03000 family)